jgi:hypothetical protein
MHTRTAQHLARDSLVLFTTKRAGHNGHRRRRHRYGTMGGVMLVSFVVLRPNNQPGNKILIVTGSRLVRVLTRVNAAVPVVTRSSASSVWERSEPTSGGGLILHLRLCLSALSQYVRSSCSIGILPVFVLGRSQLSFDST